jgi:hypothetical protein
MLNDEAKGAANVQVSGAFNRVRGKKTSKPKI